MAVGAGVLWDKLRKVFYALAQEVFRDTLGLKEGGKLTPQEVRAQLRRHVAAVVSKRVGQAVGLWGEPGIGKSFTALALLQEAPCWSQTLNATVSDAALVLALPRPPRRPVWSEVLRERLTKGHPIGAQALLDVLVATLSALAPFVLHLEDLHEASSEREQLVYRLAACVSRLRGVGLLVTSRSELAEPFKSYRLEALDRAASDSLLEAQAGRRLPPEGLEWVFGRGRGNPLFTLEFWRYLVRQGFFWSDGEAWHWRSPPEDFIPISVEALISRMLQDVIPADAPEIQAVLEARALLPHSLCGEGLDERWARVAGVCPSVLARARALLNQKGVLEQDRFAHPLIQEVAEREIPGPRRQIYARRALETLAQWPEEAACFLEEAGLEPKEALKILDAAVESAGARGDKAAQARWLAETAQRSAPDQAERAFQAAQLFKSVDLVRAARMAQVAVTASPFNLEATFLLAELLALLGHKQRAEALLQGATPSGVYPLRLWEMRIRVANHTGQWAEVYNLWNQEPLFQTKASPGVRIAVGSSLAYLNRLEEAERILEGFSDKDLLAPDIQLSFLNLRAQVLAYRGRYKEALKVQSQGIALAKAMGWAPNLVPLLLNRASLLSLQGRRNRAKPCLQEARGLAAQLGDTLRYGVVQLRLADILAKEGEFEQAEALLLEAHDLLSQHHHLQWLTESHLKLARLYLTWQPPYGPILALKNSRAALGLTQSSGDLRFRVASLSYLSRAHACLGHAQAALEMAQQCLQVATSEGVKVAEAWFAYGLALEASGCQAEALEAISQACALQKEREVAEQFGLEADRLAGDLDSARRRYEWFVSQGLMGSARMALRYFPLLANPKLKDKPQAGLRLLVLGPPDLERNGQPLGYRARKRMELLAYLLEAHLAGRSEVSFLELADVFYPDLPELQAKATLKQQVYLIRRDLGAEVVRSTPNGYALGAVVSDAQEFLRSGDPALWRGCYLGGLGMGWNNEVREALLLALGSKAHGLLASHPLQAARLAQIWLEMEPYDPDALRVKVQALQAAGQWRSALRAYREGRERLSEVGETLPARLEEFLQPSLRQG